MLNYLDRLLKSKNFHFKTPIMYRDTAGTLIIKSSSKELHK